MSELTTTLNLFKSQDKEVHKIAYELLNNQLPQELSRNSLENLMKYFETADHVPGKFHNLVYMKILNLLDKIYNNFLYSAFVKECLVADQGPGCDIDNERYVTHEDMYKVYKTWHSKQNLSNICSQDELRNQLKVVFKYGPCFGDKWLGYRICDKTKFEARAEWYFYQLFIKDKIEKTDVSVYITLEEIWKTYKEWYQQNSQTLDPDANYHYTTKDNLKKKLDVVLLPPTEDKYYGLRLKVDTNADIALLKEKYTHLEQDRDNLLCTTFVKDCLIKVEGFTISHNDMYGAYRKWFEEQCFTFKCYPKFELKHKLEALWSQKLVDNKWSGYNFIFPKENVTEFLDQMTQKVTDLNAFVTLGQLYTAYCKWSKDTPSTFEKFSDQVHINWNIPLTFKSYFDTHQFRGYCFITIDNTAATFVKNFIVEKPGLITSLNTFYNDYCKWYNQHYNYTPLSKEDFRVELRKVWPNEQNSEKELYYGIALTTSPKKEIVDFINERTEISHVSISFDELYSDYLKWTESQYPFTKPNFRDELHTVLLLPRKISDNFDDNYHCRRLRESKIIDFIRDKIVKDNFSKNALSTLESLYNAYCKHELNVNKIYPFNKQYFTEQIYAAWGVKPDSEGKYYDIKLNC